MKWHANAAELIRRTGAAGASAGRLVLDALLPGAPAFVALAGECLACAAGAGPFPDASAADLNLAAEALALLAADLHPLLLQAAELTDLPDRAARVVFRSLTADGHFRAAARRLGRLAAASDCLAAQVRRRLAGRAVEAVAAAVHAAAGAAGVVDLIDELCAAGAGPDEVRARAEAFTRAARLYAQGRLTEAARAWAELANDCPTSAAVASACAAAEVAAGAAPTTFAAADWPPGEWFVGDAARPQAGFDRADGPPEESLPGRLYQLRIARSVTDDQLAGLAVQPGSPSLYALVTAGCTRLTDAALAHLAGLTGLRVLDLGFWDHLTDAGLAQLVGLADLRVLRLPRAAKVTDAGLAHLAGLRNLRSLDLTKCDRLTDAGLAHAAELADLRSLDVSFCSRLTDAGLAPLARLARLEVLGLDGCSSITDAGLAHLYALSGLRSLSVGQCDRLSSEGVEALRTALPECEVWG